MSHLSLSRIDLFLCTPAASLFIQEVQYLVRDISDHSPPGDFSSSGPTLTLPRAPWKLNTFWLNLFPSHNRITDKISIYLQANREHPDPLIKWEAFKAFLRGLFMTEVNAIKHNTQVQREQAVQLVRRLEAEFIANSSDATREAWIGTEAAVDHLATSSADQKCFFSRLAFYEEGEQTGRLLAKILQSNQACPAIGDLRTPQKGGE